MAHELALEFLRSNPRGVLATYRRDVQAQLSPVLAAVDAEDRVVIVQLIYAAAAIFVAVYMVAALLRPDKF